MRNTLVNRCRRLLRDRTSNDAFSVPRRRPNAQRGAAGRGSFERLDDRVVLSFTPLPAESALSRSPLDMARSRDASEAVMAAPALAAEGSHAYRPDEILVGFAGAVVDAHRGQGTVRALEVAAGLVAPLGLSGGSALFAAPPLTGRAARLVTHWALPRGSDVRQVAQALSGRPGIAYAEPNGLASIQTFAGELGNPADPSFQNPAGWSFGVQEYLRQDDPVSRHISAETAWDTTLGAGVTVAVVDTGIDLDHADLNSNILRNASGTVVGASCISGNGNCSTSGAANNGGSGDVLVQNHRPGHGGGGPGGGTNQGQDDNGHGTLVAGIIAAEINNTGDLAAQAANGAWAGGTVRVAPQAKLMPVKVLGSNGSGAWADIAAGISFAASRGANIISMSLGGGFSQVVSDAIAAAYSQGVLVISAAGNGNAQSSSHPASDVYSLSVAAVDSNDVRASFSNYGFSVAVAAPGVNILSTFIDLDDSGESGGLTGAYGRISGTSMATPATSGIAALIKALHPVWSPVRIAAQLLATADNIDADNPGFEGKLGGGRINAAAALGPDVVAPVVMAVSGLGAPDGTTNRLEVGDVIGVQFSHTMDSASVLNAGNYELLYLGANGVEGGGDDQSIPLTMLSTNYDAFPGRGVQLTVNGAANADGNYLFRVLSGGATGVKAADGTFLDGDGSGAAGDHFTRAFSLVPRAINNFQPVEPIGSLVYQALVPDTFNSIGDIDRFSVVLDGDPRCFCSAKSVE